MKVLDKIRDNKVKVRAAVYTRFSSDNQRDESIDAQLRTINNMQNETTLSSLLNTSTVRNRR